MAKKRRILQPNEVDLSKKLTFLSVSTKFLPAYKLANLLNRHLHIDLKYFDEWIVPLSKIEDDVVYHRIFHTDIKNEFCSVFLIENFIKSPLFRTIDYNLKKNHFLEYDFSMIIVEFEDEVNADFIENIYQTIKDIDMWNACKSIDLQAFMKPQVILECFFAVKQKILANASTLLQI
jgi:hypothetical protein